MDTEKSYERYQRQLILKNFGSTAQQKLLQAKVLVAGAGGLGCPVLQYLAAAGTGTIGIVDDDTVSLTNLQRQVLYTTADIGKSKAIAAAGILSQLNPEINIIPYNFRLTVGNALDLIQSFDIVVDGTDNFSTRYLINDACVLLHKPLVFAAVSQYEGQLAVFNAGPAAVNYRDLFPHPPKDGQVLNCEQAGVLGVLPGIIGSMQANETIKLITGIGKPLINRLLTYNALNNQIYETGLSIRKDSRALIPADASAFKQMDYDWLCGVKAADDIVEIDSVYFDNLKSSGNVLLVDVREPGELPLVTEFAHLQLPLSSIDAAIPIGEANEIVLFCQTGKRSLKAAMLLSGIFGNTKKLYSLQGGILAWKQQQAKQLS